MRISDWSSDVCSSDLKFADEGPAHVGGDRGDAARLPSRSAAIAGDRGQQIFVAVIDVAADQGGQRHFLPQPGQAPQVPAPAGKGARSEEHTSELQSLMRTSYAVFCLKKKKHNPIQHLSTQTISTQNVLQD